MEYIVNDRNAVLIDGEIIISNEQIIGAINFCNNAIHTLDEQTKQFDINIFEVLGMRNLSGMVGEYFAKSVERFSNGNLHSNLHQDGYPDLLRTNTIQSLNYSPFTLKLQERNIQKIKPFSVRSNMAA